MAQVHLGSWVRIMGTNWVSATVEDTVADALGAGHAGDVDAGAVASAWRDQINAALPDGVTLSGSDFYGPESARGINLADIVNSVDMWAIVEQFDTSA